MAYVRVGGGSGIDPTTYLASLPTSFSVSAVGCRGAGCSWQEGYGGVGSVAYQTLLCAGKVVVTASGANDSAFVIRHIDGTAEGSVRGTTKTIYFNEGDAFAMGGGDVSVNMTWSEV